MMKKWLLALALSAGLVSTGNAAYINRLKTFTGVASQWPWQLNSDGTFTLKQPAFSDISGLATAAQLPAFTGGDCTSTAGSVSLSCNLFNLVPAWCSPSQIASDAATCLNSAIASVSTAGGGTIRLPAGTIWTSAVILKTGVYLQGQGRDNTILKLLASKNTDLLVGDNAYSLFGTNSVGGIHNAGIVDLTLDGNGANQTGPSSSWNALNCFAFYGYSTRVDRVKMQNCYGNGMRSEWTSSGEPAGGSMAVFRDVVIDTVGAHGWNNNGPHDATINNIEVIDASQLADATYNGINSVGNVGARYVNLHPWHRSTATNRMNYSFYSSGADQVINSHFEGGRHWLYINGNGTSVSNSMFYAMFNTGSNEAGIIIAGNQNSLIGNSYIGMYGSHATYGVQFGVAASTNAFQTTIIGGQFDGFSQGPFNYVNSGGYNIVNSSCYANQTTVPGWAGTPAATDVHSCVDNYSQRVLMGSQQLIFGALTPRVASLPLFVKGATGNDIAAFESYGSGSAFVFSEQWNGGADTFCLRNSGQANGTFCHDSAGNTGLGIGYGSNITDRLLVSGNVDATGFKASGSAGLTVTKTVRASGGGSDCTLIFKAGILTGGTC